MDSPNRKEKTIKSLEAILCSEAYRILHDEREKKYMTLTYNHFLYEDLHEELSGKYYRITYGYWRYKKALKEEKLI